MQHARLGISRELQPAVLFFDDHREETMLFKVRPQLRRQIRQLMSNLEIIRHPAGFFYRAVEKRLLFGGQARLRIVMQLFPVRLALEQVALPPGGARINRFFLSARHRRHHLTETAKYRRGNHRLTHRRKVKWHEDNGQRHQYPRRPQTSNAEGGCPGEQNQTADK